jgi:hypothetical protein
MAGRRGSSGIQGIRDNIRGGGRRERKAQSVEWIETIVPSEHAHGGKVFHIQAKRVKLHRTRVVNGETTNRDETLMLGPLSTSVR